ncbi:MAG TPA: MTH938/NDUFAF3 family protein [Coxiellaceae bacterium]|nr:MTH938/NDUFAF3 family protein [Coxiellaceae bacterium]
MLLTEDTFNATYIIQAYTPTSVTINHQRYQQSLILTPHHLIPDWPVQAPAQLTALTVQPLLDLEPDLILLGTGIHFTMPPQDALRSFVNSRIGFEPMSTLTAIRTFVALAAEGRRVACGLIL